MNPMIQEWKDEHVAIQDALRATIRLDIGSKAGREKMREFKELLLRHLQREDDVLYPVLKKAAEKSESLGRVLELFAKDMNDIVPVVLAFFKKYEKDSDSEDLPAELGEIDAILLGRINREENILMEEYERTLG